jgi:hypothetical protein
VPVEDTEEGTGLRTFRFQALVTLDPTGPDIPAMHYPGGPHGILVHARQPGHPDRDIYFPAALCRDDEQPLKPGDHAVVTVILASDQAGSFLTPGQRFTLWAGHDIGHGVISR